MKKYFYNHSKHLKPVYWGLFSAGGTIAALILAPLLFILCLALPFGLLGNPAAFYQHAHGLVSNKIVFLLLAGVIFLMMWHGSHRFYYVLHDLHIHVGQRTRLTFYAITIAAFLLTLFAGW